MNAAFLVVSVLYSLAVLTGGKKNTRQMEQEEAQDYVGAVGGCYGCIGGGSARP